MKPTSTIQAGLPWILLHGTAWGASASILHFNTPVVLEPDADGEAITLDIDGNGTEALWVGLKASASTAYMSFRVNTALAFNFFGPSGLGLPQISPLASTEQVGPSVVSHFQIAGLISSSLAPVSYRLWFMTYQGLANSGQLQGLTEDTTQYIGFRFSTDAGSNWNYGWASLSFSLVESTRNITLSEWAIENVSNQPIQVGATSGGASPAPSTVPEPTSTATALALLACGAAGIRRWKRG